MAQPAAHTQLAMRRSVWIDADPDRVWKEFETTDAMKGWWETADQRLERYEPGEGGWFEIAGTHGSFEYRLGGRIIEWESPNRLVMEWDSLPSGEWAAPLTVTLSLSTHLGGTVVEIVQNGFERIGAAAARVFNSFEAGWTVGELVALKRRVEA